MDLIVDVVFIVLGATVAAGVLLAASLGLSLLCMRACGRALVWLQNWWAR